MNTGKILMITRRYLRSTTVSAEIFSPSSESLSSFFQKMSPRYSETPMFHACRRIAATTSFFSFRGIVLFFISVPAHPHLRPAIMRVLLPLRLPLLPPRLEVAVLRAHEGEHPAVRDVGRLDAHRAHLVFRHYAQPPLRIRLVLDLGQLHPVDLMAAAKLPASLQPLAQAQIRLGPDV